MNQFPLAGLYAITDERLNPEHLENCVKGALRGGCRWIQYRDKSTDRFRRLRQAQRIAHLCKQAHCGFIVNDDVELAAHCHADGVHVGMDDTSPEIARRVLGSDAIIGVSCYDRIELAREAVAQGANYIAFGSLFPSSTKPNAVHCPLNVLAEAKKELGVPICAIGGIDIDTIDTVLNAGADLIAVVSAIFGNPDCEKAARTLNEHIFSIANKQG